MDSRKSNDDVVRKRLALIRPNDFDGKTPATNAPISFAGPSGRGSSSSAKPTFVPNAPSRVRRVEKPTLTQDIHPAESARQMFMDIAKEQDQAATRTPHIFGPRTHQVHMKSAVSNASRKLQQRRRDRAGKSKELIDMTIAEDMMPGSYCPLALPFYEMDALNLRDSSTSPKKSKTKRHTMTFVDEMNRNPSKLLLDEGNLKQEECFIWQMPDILPFGRVPEPEEEEGGAPAGDGPKTTKGGITAFTNRKPDDPPACSMSKLPEGQIGTLRVYKSGKVEMVLGGLPFTVDQGSECHFAQQLACLCEEEKEVMFIGSVGKRMVVTPNVTELMKAADQELFG